MKSLNSIISEIRYRENKFSNESSHLIDEAYQMILYLKELLHSTREKILREGFKNETEEIEFFRDVKPLILSRLIYYNKVFRFETICPVKDGKLYKKFFIAQLQLLKLELKKYSNDSYFFRYYRSGRSDRDQEYYVRGKINYRAGLNSYVFEMDHQFSTYYDSKAARIIANELLHSYLINKINYLDSTGLLLQNSASSEEVFWTDTKVALTELIYALHASGAISHGKLGIRKVSMVFQTVFRLSLGDIHHSFHRMKDRAGARTSYLDQLKFSLEQYMDKGI